MRCPGCGASIALHANFCPACGLAVARRCAGCDTLLGPTAKFCSECGRPAPGRPPRAAVPATPFATPQVYTPRHLAEKMLASQIAAEGERKQVTVLFADLQGSMQLLAELDPEEARTLLDPVLELMMEAVHWYEGTVNQVMGDGIMALFGAPLAQEDHAVRACYAALRMHEAVKRYARDHGDRAAAAQMRIGLNSGAVVVRAIGSDLRMDYSAVGQTTHVAGRMEQMATPGMTLLAPATAALVEGFVRLRSLGHHVVKGLAEPLELFELLGAEPVRSRLQAHAGRLTAFVNRTAELAELATALEHAQAGHGQMVALVSEPGVGKSRLLAEFLASPRTTGCVILETGCVSYRSAPYAPIVELLRRLLQVGAHDAPLTIRQKLAAKLAALGSDADTYRAPCLWLLDVEVDDARWARLDAEQRRRRALDAVRTLLLHECERQPVIVVWEDLHWIDADSQAFLDELVETVAGIRLLLLVDYRPEYQHGWADRAHYRHLRINGLPPATVDELLESLLGPDPALAPLKRPVAERTDGNPFFIEETVRTLRETGALARGHAPRALDVLDVPPTVQAVIAARIDRLPDTLKRLLQSAAVIGHDVPFTLLREITEMGAGELREGLARLQSAEFLYEAQIFPDIEYRFRHTLTHDVAYGSVVTGRRRSLHARITQAIERVQAGKLAEHVERLAHHAARAELWDKAVIYLRQAGEKALSRSAMRDAAQSFEQALAALEHLERDADTLRLAVDLRLDLRAALYALGDFGPMLRHLREADEIARKIDDPRRVAWVSIYIGEHWRQAGEFGRALELAGRALALGETIGDPAVVLAAHQYLGLACHAIGEYRRAAEHMRTIAEVPEDESVGVQFRPTQAGSRAGFRAVSLGWLARCLAETGDFVEGRAHGLEGVRIGESLDHPYSLVSAAWGLGYLHAVQGDGDQAVRVLERALATAREARLTRLLPQVMRALGLAYVLVERAREAVVLLEEAVSIVESMGLAVGQSSTLAQLGESYLRAGRHEDAARATGQAFAIAREQGQHGDKAVALFLRAELDAALRDTTEARRNYGQAVVLAESLGMRPLMARARLGLGLLLQRGRDATARPTLEEARAMFRELGMPRWVAAADAGLDACR